MLARLRPHWPLVALLISGALLAGAHAFESFGGLRPCVLCLEQRERHWWIVGASAVLFLGGLFFGKRVGWYYTAAAAILGVLFLVSLKSAGYHVGVEQHIWTAQCDTMGDIHHIRPMTFGNEPLNLPRCDAPQWSLFGLTMAAYNAIISLAAALASFAVALARPGKPS